MTEEYNRSNHPRTEKGTFALVYDEPVSKKVFGLRLPESLDAFVRADPANAKLAREILIKGLSEVVHGKNDGM